MYCGIVSIMEVAPCVGGWMRVNGERLARRKKDSDTGLADGRRPIWLGRGACVAAVPQGGTGIGDCRTTDGALKCAATTATSNITSTTARSRLAGPAATNSNATSKTPS